ncbi:MAG: hypothetical protein LZF60_270200 [Nitrospira sp.]|nr:MAG: hypothetical protein LZF60_270200 [Nitrospira sp.]
MPMTIPIGWDMRTNYVYEASERYHAGSTRQSGAPAPVAAEQDQRRGMTIENRAVRIFPSSDVHL